MRILVMGGGVVGVTTAYQLQRDGHEVVVVERNGLTASGTSWGNAGMIMPGHSFSWSSPMAPMILLKSLFLKDQALRFRLSADPRLYYWTSLFSRQCMPESARRNTLLKHRLAMYSQKVLERTLGEEPIDYDRDRGGILYYHRSKRALEVGIARMKLLEADGQRIEVLDRKGVSALDPSLGAAASEIVGGIYCPTDETGDPAKFTRALAELIVARGGKILTGVTIGGIETSGGSISRIATDKGPLTAEAYVLALGSESAPLARKIGVKLPIYPIKGYSLTIPVGNQPSPPRVASLDADSLLAISRFGDRVRVTATAEFAGYDTSHKPGDFAFIKRVTQQLYPDGADFDRAEMWAGLRPTTPNNLPLFGRKGFANLYLNTGHGDIGWTTAHGSARLTADLIAGRTPEIPIDGLLA